MYITITLWLLWIVIWMNLSLWTVNTYNVCCSGTGQSCESLSPSEVSSRLINNKGIHSFSIFYSFLLVSSNVCQNVLHSHSLTYKNVYYVLYLLLVLKFHSSSLLLLILLSGFWTLWKWAVLPARLHIQAICTSKM